MCLNCTNSTRMKPEGRCDSEPDVDLAEKERREKINQAMSLGIPGSLMLTYYLCSYFCLRYHNSNKCKDRKCYTCRRKVVHLNDQNYQDYIRRLNDTQRNLAFVSISENPQPPSSAVTNGSFIRHHHNSLEQIPDNPQSQFPPLNSHRNPHLRPGGTVLRNTSIRQTGNRPVNPLADDLQTGPRNPNSNSEVNPPHELAQPGSLNFSLAPPGLIVPQPIANPANSLPMPAASLLMPPPMVEIDI